MDVTQFSNSVNRKFMEADLANTLLIIDEYDNLLFTSKKDQQNFEMIEKVRNFEHVIGFSGTSLSKVDHQILKVAFQTTEVKFPLLRDTSKSQIAFLKESVHQNLNVWREELVHLV